MTYCKEFRLNNAIGCPYNIFMVLYSKLKNICTMLENISNSDCKAEREVEEVIRCKSMKVKVEIPTIGRPVHDLLSDFYWFG